MEIPNLQVNPTGKLFSNFKAKEATDSAMLKKALSNQERQFIRLYRQCDLSVCREKNSYGEPKSVLKNGCGSHKKKKNQVELQQMR